MRVLSTILKENRITSYYEFNKYINSSVSELPTINEDDLKRIVNYDSCENRIFEEEINLSGKFIDIERLNLRDQNNITFIDCVFSGDIFISKANKIDFGNCIFMKKVTFSFVESLQINSCNANELFIINSNLKLNLSYSNIHRIGIENSNISSQSFFENKIEHIGVLGVKYEGVMWDFSQINIKKIDNLDNYLEEKADENYVFKPIIGYEKKNNDRRVLNNTIEFILKNTNIHYDKTMQNKLLYNKTYISYDNIISRALIKLTGGFSKPIIWVGHFLITTFAFALIYLFPLLKFQINDGIQNMQSFWDSLYFSGITFTTIGYGDIVPLGWARFLSVLEGLMGIGISSAFIVSIVKKYID